MTYGERLQKALTASEKTRKQLAVALGCTVQAVGMVITGGGKKERGLSAENNVKAAQFLRVDAYWLATGDGEMKPKAGSNNKTHTNLSDDALDLAVYFDKLTNEDDRTRAYVSAMAEILKVMDERDQRLAAPATAAPGQAANPKKQSV